MLELPELARIERPSTHTTFTLFDHGHVTGSDSIRPKPRNPATSRTRKAVRANESANENGSDNNTSNTVNGLSPLPADSLLARVISQVDLPIGGWEPLHIFKLFVVLLDPPSNQDLDAIPGLYGYLTKLVKEMGSLIENGIRSIVCRCWWALQCKSYTHSLPSVRFLHFYSAMQGQRAVHARAMGTSR
jgi:hypothetical protein